MTVSKPYNDFTIVIQGPLHKNLITGLKNNYFTYTDNIIVSHWDIDDASIYDELISLGLPIQIITNNYHNNFNVFNEANIYYHSFSTSVGIERVTTPFVIKVRSDQWFGNLVPLFEKIREQPNKYVCANLHFRPERIYPYHPSDKLFGSNTNDIQNMMRVVMYRLQNNVRSLMAGAYMYTDNRNIASEELILTDMNLHRNSVTTLHPEKPSITAVQIIKAPGGWEYVGMNCEQVFGTSYLFAKGIYPSPSKSKEIVTNNFEIVCVEDMIPYINKFFGYSIEHNWEEIHKITDY